MDVCITHPHAPSNMSTTVEKLLQRNEAENNTKYASRVINTEHASFIPLMFYKVTLIRVQLRKRARVVMRGTPPALQIAAENFLDVARSESGELSRDGHDRPSIRDTAASQLNDLL